MAEQEAGELTSAGPHEYGSRGAFRPQIHGGYAWLIARDDVAARLDRAAAGMVTIISAPAGSGKTTLLRAWAQRTGKADRVAYVPVRRDERDAQVFWGALLNAVRGTSGAASDPEPLTATPDFDVRASADRLLSELAGQRGRPPPRGGQDYRLANHHDLVTASHLPGGKPGPVAKVRIAEWR